MDPELRERRRVQAAERAKANAAAMKGKPMSEEHRAKLREGQARRRARMAESAS